MKFNIKTWSCVCGYSQDFFSEICPSCGGALSIETDPTKMVTVNIMEEKDIKDGENKVERKEDIKEAVEEMKLLEVSVV